MKKSNLNSGCKDKLKKKVQIVNGFNFKKNSRNKKKFSQIITPLNSNMKNFTENINGIRKLLILLTLTLNAFLLEK